MTQKDKQNQIESSAKITVFAITLLVLTIPLKKRPLFL